MLIKSIEMISFGKFKNKTINFNSGLNIICGDNESGKSTVISFIYAMLYGFGDNRGKGLSFREKYTPWDASFCEGKLNFISDNGENITVYRKSGTAKKYDILHMYNSDSGKEISSTVESFVGINSDTFFKTICLQQQSCVTDGSNDEITQKLANLASSGDENVSCEKAKKILENLRREIKPLRGEGGLLTNVAGQIFRLEQEKAAQDTALTEINNAKNLLPVEKEKLGKMKEELARISSEDYNVQIAHLRGRIEERNKNEQNISPSGKAKLVFFSGALAFFMLFIILMVSGSNLSYVFLIPSAFCLITGLFNKKENNADNNTNEDLTYELIRLQSSKEVHDKKLSDLEKAITQKEKKIIHLESAIQVKKGFVTDNIDEKLSMLYLQKQRLNKKLNAITLASEALEKASEKMKTNFTPAINKRASEYFKMLSGNKYDGIFCDENFEIKVDCQIPRSYEFFSGGCIDQMYLSLRLALTDMLFKEKTSFMLLDQPFMQYDEKRSEGALLLLRSLPENRQILLFENYVERFSGNKNTEILT